MSKDNEEKSNISRRDFLKGAAGSAIGISMMAALPGCASAGSIKGTEAGAGVGAHEWSWETPPKAIPESLIKETVKADVIIVGAGPSGFYTAASALDNGLSVAVVAKGDKFNALGGATFAFNSKFQKQIGYEVNTEEVVSKFLELNGNKVNQRIVWTWANRSGEAMDWLIEKMKPFGLHPVMQSFPQSGYPGTHLFHGGPNTPTDIGDYDPYCGDLGLGFVPQIDVSTSLEKYIQDKGGKIFYSHSCERILRGGNGAGPVESIIVKDKEGRYKKFVGAKGIVIAAGCYGANKEMVKCFCPQLANSENVAVFTSNTGDLHRQALWIGAAMQRLSDHAVSVFCGDARGVWNVLVNKSGKRFVCEDNDTASLSASIMMQPESACYGIWDESYAEELPAIPGHVQDKRQTPEIIRRNWAKHIGKGFFKCDTVEELARNLGLPPDQVAATVKKYNADVAKGTDSDFHKRSSLLFPLDPPYYGAKFGLACLSVHGGLHVNERSQVLTPEHQPIDNLYAVGLSAGDFWANFYSTRFAGNSLGHCLTFGYLVGRQLAGRE